MPKKKLTKTQIKKKLNAISNNMYSLFLDKLGHSDSKVPMTTKRMQEWHKYLQQAERIFMRR